MNPSRSHIFREISAAVLNGKANEVVRLVESGLKMSMSAEEILEEALIPATLEVAERFQGADFYIPDVLLASRAIKAGIHALKPLEKRPYRGKRIVIGTVAGDIHDIGKNLIALFLEFVGYEVIDLGVDVTAENFIQAVRQYEPHILGMSALLTTTMGEMSHVIDALKSNRLRERVKVIVGGGPVTKEFAASIGADGYADTPHEAIRVVNELLGSKG
ncbi:MAG: cobalamin B12-binding domain-containing protein [Thermacetogeniaceae bacterium]